MGFLDSIKAEVQAARSITADSIVVTPAPRIDTLATEAASGRQRTRTDYAGTVWFGGRPQEVSGRTVPGATARVDTPFVLPDSHAYEAPQELVVQATASLQTARATDGGGEADILATEPAVIDGRLHLHVSVRGMLPIGVVYRVTVLGP